MKPRLIYNWFIIPLLWVGFRASSPFIHKVNRGIRGRTGWKESLRRWANSQTSDKPVWLFHAASVGELEAIRPIINGIAQRGNLRVIITVFSPSAYDANAVIPGVEILLYLPFDSIGNQRFLLDTIRPQLIAISKHDVWPNLLVAAQERGIVTALINANFHPRSLRIHPAFRLYNRWVFSLFDGIATVSEEHSRRLDPFLDRTEICRMLGDSRYDRVLERVGKHSDQIVSKAELLRNKTVIVAGSTHPTEEQFLIPVISELISKFHDIFVIWVPHDPEPSALESLERNLRTRQLSTIRWSANTSFEGHTGVIVDVVGILAELYTLGDIALVGGGFDKGVHSVIEPAAAGLPVIFGPQYHVSQEASYLIEKGGGFVFNEQQDLAAVLHSMLENPGHLRSAGDQAKSVVDENVGASERIIEFLEDLVTRKKNSKVEGKQ